jgi:murein DD-endopeptidase MepM/ murein hydrolase activator NlpD
MPIGSTIVAMRGGVVSEVEESHTDGQVSPIGFDNYLLINHDDGTSALYGHLTHNGASVAVGQVVAQGQAIALSGNTGNTGGVPHLHVSVQGCDPVALGTRACPSLALTFSNTDANPGGLITGQTYRAN